MPISGKSKARLCGAAGAIALLAGLAELAGFGSLNPLLEPARAAAREIAALSAAVFVSIQGINAVLSFAQEIEIGASAIADFGVQPMKLLEPADDVVEQIASWLFVIAAGAALVGVGIGPAGALGAIVLGAALLSLAPRIARGESPGALTLRSARLGAALAVFLPVVFVAGTALGDFMTRAAWNDAFGAIDRLGREAVEEAESAQWDVGSVGNPERAAAGETSDGGNGGGEGDESGWFSGLVERASNAKDAIGDVAASVGRYRDIAAKYASSVDELLDAGLTIIGVFALRILVLPLLLLWVAVSLAGRFRES